ncbi:glycosyltransferase [Croceivirga radicis]|uniref:Glycosyltransferase n=1 Tax=Croceivirga radicis TaxID=1929488 RepID=A0A1V6LSC6_9FLAO|nr:glycosyltransferase [Croceivirga radicis]OQD43084.1 glycosyltransferase [Croceivirga radicis]
MSSLKISIFIYSLAGGGAERAMSYLLNYLEEHQYPVVLVLMNDTIAYPIPSTIDTYYLEKSNPNESGILKLLKLPYLAFKYARLLKTLQITHSFSLLTRPCYINIMARWFTKHQYKLIISERSFPTKQYAGNHLQAKINRFMVKWLYPKADAILSNAKASKIDLVTHFKIPKEKISYIYNPIDLDKISGIVPNNDFYDSNYINLVTVGRLMTVKNHSFLIKAMEPFKNVRLYIFGDGELYDQLKTQIMALNLENNVFLMGFEQNPFTYLKAADIFVLSSIFEGFPNVLMEALSCGLPVISTNCQSGPDEMLELEQATDQDIMFTKYGILTPVNNLELMQKAIAFMIANPEFRKSCTENAPKRIKAYDKNHILKQYCEYILA